MITLSRNTYQAKKQLAAYGATYIPSEKSWKMTESAWSKFKADYPIMSSEMAPSIAHQMVDAGDINNLLRANGNAACIG